MFDNDTDPAKYVEEHGMKQENDEGAVKAICEKVIAENPQSVADYKGGKEKAIMAIYGKCMKELKGNCDPQSLRTKLIEYINSL